MNAIPVKFLYHMGILYDVLNLHNM